MRSALAPAMQRANASTHSARGEGGALPPMMEEALGLGVKDLDELPRTPVSELLQRWSKGDGRAADELFVHVYDQLHRLARQKMAGQRADHSLQATALVNEAWLRLAGETGPDCKDREHFLALAARAMRSILVDHARSKNRDKRRPKGEHVGLDELVESYSQHAFDLIQLNDVLEKLAQIDERLVRLIELRFFAGLSMEEAASVLGMPLRSAEREWAAARAWLRKEMT